MGQDKSTNLPLHVNAQGGDSPTAYKETSHPLQDLEYRPYGL